MTASAIQALHHGCSFLRCWSRESAWEATIEAASAASGGANFNRVETLTAVDQQSDLDVHALLVADSTIKACLADDTSPGDRTSP